MQYNTCPWFFAVLIFAEILFESKKYRNESWSRATTFYLCNLLKKTKKQQQTRTETFFLIAACQILGHFTDVYDQTRKLSYFWNDGFQGSFKSWPWFSVGTSWGLATIFYEALDSGLYTTRTWLHELTHGMFLKLRNLERATLFYKFYQYLN